MLMVTSSNALPLSAAVCLLWHKSTDVCVQGKKIVTCVWTATTERANKQWEAAITIRALHLTHRTII